MKKLVFFEFGPKKGCISCDFKDRALYKEVFIDNHLSLLSSRGVEARHSVSVRSISGSSFTLTASFFAIFLKFIGV